MELISVLILSLSLSMDAFSLALAYGTLNLPRKLCMKISISVGMFHFFMPLLGMSVKYLLVQYSDLSFHYVTFLIYLYLGIMLLLEAREERKVSSILSLKDILLFSLAVSLDSFSVGVAQQKFVLLAPIFFAIFSCFFTYLGLRLGKKLYSFLGKVAIIIGGIFFCLLAFFHL